MSELAYDISYLLDNEPAQAEPPVARVARAVPAPPPTSLADVQSRLARELLQAADAHEEWIRQYLSVCSAAVADAMPR
jgi:hypothetical protein